MTVLETLTNWFKTNGFTGDQNLYIKQSDENKGYGCFAKKNLFAGEILFKIPRSHIISFNNVYLDSSFFNQLEKYKSYTKNSPLSNKISAEFLIWIYICEQKKSKNSKFFDYLNSLPTIPPNISTWDDNLVEKLKGSNLYHKIVQDKTLFKDYELLLEEIKKNIIPEDDDQRFSLEMIDIQDVLWARNHYLSRRYPGEYGQFSSNSEDKLQEFKRERDLQDLGAYVPLLDLLNHKNIKNGKEWLTFDLDDRYLTVLTNFDVNEHMELYSNYGSKPNEMLLYAYGFSIENNIFDSVSLKLCFMNEKNAVKDYGVFYILKNGIEGVPKVKSFFIKTFF